MAFMGSAGTLMRCLVYTGVQTPERLAIGTACGSPPIRAHRIDGIVERSDDVKPIEHRVHVGTVNSDGVHAGLAHVAACAAYPCLLSHAELLAAELVDAWFTCCAPGDGDRHRIGCYGSPLPPWANCTPPW